MNKTLLSLGIAMVLCTGAARAQVAVFDPANFQENLLTAARTLEQINNQVRQLQNQAQMLANQERDLNGLDRPEERRGGKEWCRSGSSRGSPCTSKKKT